MFRVAFWVLPSLLAVALLAACSPRWQPVSQTEPLEPTRPATSRPRPVPSPSLQSIASAYFRGADCYGEKVADCLAVNADLDARASDPTICQGAEAHVCLVPVGNVRADVVDTIVRFHRETKGLDVVVLPSIPMRATMIYPETSQVAEWTIMEAMEDAYGVTNNTPSTFIGITPIDIRPRSGEYEWMFGARFGRDRNGNHNHGAFSYFRMQNVRPYDGTPLTDDLLGTRAAKYAARYTALLYFDYPVGRDRRYLNYKDMYGFSDLDSMGTLWPHDPPPGP